MNEELKQQALDALKTVLTDAASVRDFAVEQAPDVVIQLLTWQCTISVIYCTIFCLLPPVIFMLSHISGFYCVEDRYKSPVGKIMTWGIMLITMLISLFVVCSWGAEALHIWIAPKHYLMMYVLRL